MIADEPIAPKLVPPVISDTTGDAEHRARWNNALAAALARSGISNDGGETGGNPPHPDDERNKHRLAYGLSIGWEQYGTIRVFRDQAATIYLINGSLHVVPRTETFSPIAENAKDFNADLAEWKPKL